jgi:hypothetical protein
MTRVKFDNREMQIAARDGKIVLLFSRVKPNGDKVPAKLENFDFPVSQAAKMAQLIVDLAFEEDSSLKPVGDVLKAELVERHRTTLTARLALMLGTLREDREKTNGQVAKLLVDAMLKEVF